ncbi:MAG: peptidoglycan DD-metalloendopeptidase family protein [Balneolaceae bacterium]|nr:peptidoglycan DD-metalloendopeptidase family protein [Balneolaceae bacterium]MDR9409493.1 peptidoglycan DD-metalloendopeptidase family protein [Balneolaceae bacterium]
MSVHNFHNILFLICLITLGLIHVHPINAQPLSFLVDSVEYVWPTDATNQISSTFGETRSAHLHAGLDIRTWGQEGYKVFATRDGIIYRIGTGPHGYGNVLYMKHNDGSYSVYAHLNRFEPKLQAYTDSIRIQDYSFVMNEVIEEDSLFYEKGEVIAFTGSSGVGPPHLHFEIRNKDNEPVNPLLTNLTVRDNLPPVFRQLGIEFLNPINLKNEGFEIKNARRDGRNYEFGEITVNQPVGLSVNLHDRANNTPNAYAVYTLTLVHQSDTLYHSSVDQFSYAEGRHMFLDRSYQILAETRRAFQRLYKVNGNKLPIYRKLKNRGVLALDEGKYPLQIIASDIFGNETKAAVTLNVNGSNKIDNITDVPTYPAPGEISKPFTLNQKEVLFDNSVPMLASSEPISFSISRISDEIRFRSNSSIEKRLSPGIKQVFSTPNQQLWIEFPKEALYDSLNLHLDISRIGDEIHFNFSPDRLPIEGEVYFNYILPDELKDNEHLGLFSVDKFRNRTYFMWATNKDGMIRSPLREISSLVIMEDKTSPWVGKPHLEKNLAGNYVIRVPAVDRDTGIDYQASNITVNGKRGIIEYDPDRNSLFYYIPGYVPENQNQVEIEVFDGMGNRTSKTESFTF